MTIKTQTKKQKEKKWGEEKELISTSSVRTLNEPFLTKTHQAASFLLALKYLNENIC